MSASNAPQQRLHPLPDGITLAEPAAISVAEPARAEHHGAPVRFVITMPSEGSELNAPSRYSLLAMLRLLDAHGAACDLVIGTLLWLAVQLHRWQRWSHRKVLRVRGSLLRVWHRWMARSFVIAECRAATHGIARRLPSRSGWSISTSTCRTSAQAGHAWTNGRIERVFRTFKETVFGFICLFSSRAQVERFAADFLQWHNRDRPHSSWGGRTPNEVWLGRKSLLRARGRVAYFDGHLHWWRFG